MTEIRELGNPTKVLHRLVDASPVTGDSNIVKVLRILSAEEGSQQKFYAAMGFVIRRED